MNVFLCALYKRTLQFPGLQASERDHSSGKCSWLLDLGEESFVHGDTGQKKQKCTAITELYTHALVHMCRRLEKKILAYNDTFYIIHHIHVHIKVTICKSCKTHMSII